MDNPLAFHGAGLQHPLLQLQNIHSIAIKLPALGGNGDTFGGAQNKLRMQLLLQLINMSADGWLGNIQLSGSLSEAFLLHHRNEALQLFKLQGLAPP